MRWCRGAQGWDAGDSRRLLAAATNSQGAERTHRCGQTWRFQCERMAFGECESGQGAQTEVAILALCTRVQTGRTPWSARNQCSVWKRWLRG